MSRPHSRFLCRCRKREDTHRPFAMHPTDNLTKPVRLGAMSMAKITRALLDGACSIRELQIISGLSTNTLHEYMRALRKEKVVHISAWEKDATGRDSLRVFKLGDGKDAPRARKSKALIARECRQRKKDARLAQSFAQIIPLNASASKPASAPAPISASTHKLMRQGTVRSVLQQALR